MTCSENRVLALGLNAVLAWPIALSANCYDKALGRV
jgi:hypothetical protein